MREVRPATSDEIADSEDLLESAEHEGCDEDHDHDHHHEAPVQLVQLGTKPKKTSTPS